jgi:hypothetical protein
MDIFTIIGWFSGGVTSAVAIKKVIDRGHKVIPIYFETGIHHEDHQRFIKDCEDWYGTEIIQKKNPKYRDVIDVIRKTRFINSAYGAKCTGVLKKDMRYEVEKQMKYDYQIFGFEHDKKQINRAVRFQEQNPNAKAIFPLIELKLTKPDCFGLLPMEIPAMYKLGYHNSNCIGCVKGGMGYWNKIRKDFPDYFQKMATVEREINRSCIKGVFLDELSPNAGRHEDFDLGECGVVCSLELSDLPLITEINSLTNRIF